MFKLELLYLLYQNFLKLFIIVVIGQLNFLIRHFIHHSINRSFFLFFLLFISILYIFFINKIIKIIINKKMISKKKLHNDNTNSIHKVEIRKLPPLLIEKKFYTTLE